MAHHQPGGSYENRDLRPGPARYDLRRRRRPDQPPGRRVLRTVVIVATLLLAAATVVVLVRSPGSTDVASDPGALPSPSAASSGPACPPGVALRVVAASGIAPVLRAAATAACIPIDLTVDDTAAPAQAVRSGGTDVWVPDSRERAFLALGPDATTLPSTATSPLVMVAAPDTARALSARGPVSWGLLLAPDAIAPLTAAIQDPATSGASVVLAGALAQVGTTAAGGNANSGVAAAAQGITSLGTVPSARLDRADPTAIDVVEKRLVPGGSSDSPVTVVTAEGVPFLDYPFVRAPAPSPAAAAAGAKLVAALAGPAAVAARTAAGLLPPGTTSVRLGAGEVPATLIPHVDAASVPTSIAIASTDPTPASVLAVLDVSGSMADHAADQPAPIDVVKASAQTFFTTFGQGVDLGLWEFGYRLTPQSDHREVFPVQPFEQSRALLGPAIAAVQAQATGTALYQTTLDAYRTVQAGWKPNTANLVAIFTDGRNEDAPGLDGPALLQALQAQADPARPVQVIFFGYGQADVAAMTAITQITGGGVYPIATPTDIVGAFIRASGQIAVSG